MKVTGKAIYQVGDVEIDVGQNCLRRNGREQHLRPKTFQVLVYLIENRERVVPKEELIESLWTDTAVTDDALVQCLLEIRKALGDDSRHPRFIKTITKVGYHFIGPIAATRPAVTESGGAGEKGNGGENAPGFRLLLASLRHRLILVGLLVLLVSGLGASLYWRGAGQARLAAAETALPQIPGKKSLLVMRFENRSGDPDVDWLREGLADMLITNLSRSPKLLILSRQQLYILLARLGHNRAEAVPLEEALAVAQKTRAEIIILGSFAKVAGKIRVDAQIYQGSTGNLLAAEGFTADAPEQILAQIDALSLKLASHLGAARDEREIKPEIAFSMTNNLDAYRYYSLALEKIQMFEYPAAIELLEKAVALDPQFALAHARIGYVYAVRQGLGGKGKPHFDRAFQLADRLSEREKLYLTAWSASVTHDVESALQTYRQLIAGYPFEVEAYQRLGSLLDARQRYEEARNVLLQAVVIDHESKDLHNILGGVYTHLGKQTEAQAEFERYIALAPNDPNAYDSLANFHQWFGRYDQAMEIYNRALSINPESGVAIIHLGHTYLQQGRYRAAIEQYRRYVQVAPTDAARSRGYDNMAYAYWQKGDLAQAANAARQAVKYSSKSSWTQIVIAFGQGQKAEAQRLAQALFANYDWAEYKERGFLRFYEYYTGYVALQEGKTTEALEHFQAALKYHAPIWHVDTFEDCLAQASLQTGNPDGAIAEYERILSINPNYPLAHYHLAQAYEQKGERAQAKEFYERFLQVWHNADTDAPALLDARQRLTGL